MSDLLFWLPVTVLYIVLLVFIFMLLHIIVFCYRTTATFWLCL